MGVDGLDPDLPSEIEGKLFSSLLGKFVWVVLFPATYSLRPMLMRPKNVREGKGGKHNADLGKIIRMRVDKIKVNNVKVKNEDYKMRIDKMNVIKNTYSAPH